MINYLLADFILGKEKQWYTVENCLKICLWFLLNATFQRITYVFPNSKLVKKFAEVKLPHALRLDNSLFILIPKRST